MSGRLYASRRIGGVSMNGVAGLFFAVAIVAALPAMSETWTYNGDNNGDPVCDQNANYAAAML